MNHTEGRQADTLITPTSKIQACDFCEEFAGRPSHFSRLYGEELKERVISATAKFAVLPSIGQIAEGYSLVVSKSHLTSISTLPAELLDELDGIVQQLRHIFRAVYGCGSIFFEHGVPDGSPAHGGCGIYHLHLHAVPVFGETELLPLSDFEFGPLASFSSLSSLYGGHTPYLLYIDQAGQLSSTSADAIPSQYFRMILAKAMGVPDWDWRAAQREPRFFRAHGELRMQFSKSRLGIVAAG